MAGMNPMNAAIAFKMANNEFMIAVIESKMAIMNSK
jgi:hypothetical protein